MITLHEYTRLPASLSIASNQDRLIVRLASVSIAACFGGMIGYESFRLGSASSSIQLGLLAFVLFLLVMWAFGSKSTAPTPQQEVQVRLRIDQIASVLAVLDLEDFGPGYVITLASGEALFISGEPLSDLDEQEESLPENLEITITLPSGDLQQVAGSGNRQPVRGDISYNRLDIEDFQSFVILKPGLNLTPEIDFLTGDRQGGHDLASS